jgi:predicted ATP-dependent serine protease
MNDEQAKYHVDAWQSQIGLVGDHAHVEGGIHFHALSAPQSLHQIPEPTATFKARKKELDELTEAIRESSVAISGVRGMGGIGKTALALKLAQQLAADCSLCAYKCTIRSSTQKAFNRETYDWIKSVPAIG